MDCYKKMYCKLFNRITDVMNELQAVQMELEELFVLQYFRQAVLRLVGKNKRAN
jgi:hypothetical protein